jgi:TPR repeat protein
MERELLKAGLSFLRNLLVVGLLALSAGAWAQTTENADAVKKAFDDAERSYRAGDYAGAYYWWNILAEGGQSHAQTNLALLYLNGQGVEKSVETAIRWFERAANQDNVTAQYNLGLLYSTSKGDFRDDKRATEWLLEAANQGHPTARFLLAQRYERGVGTKRDFIEALRWAILAEKAAVKKDAFREKAVDYRERLEKRMPVALVVKAKQLAEETKGN